MHTLFDAVQAVLQVLRDPFWTFFSLVVSSFLALKSMQQQRALQRTFKKISGVHNTNRLCSENEQLNFPH